MNEITAGKNGTITVKRVGAVILALVAMAILLPLVIKVIVWLVSTVLVVGIVALIGWMIYHALTDDPDKTESM